MEMTSAARSSIDTTAASTTTMGANQNFSAAQERSSFSEHGKEMLSLCGEGSGMQAGSRESTAQFSETNLSISQASLSDRLTQSLISAGLVCGTIPTSMRRLSSQATLDFASKSPAGESAVKRKSTN